MGVDISPLLPDVELEFAHLISQFSTQLPEDVADERLEKIREIEGVETAYGKPPAALP